MKEVDGMIVKDLIDKCSIYNVAKTIAYWAKVDEKYFPDLLQRCTKLLDELKEIDDYWVCDDKNFCFIGYQVDNELMPQVILTVLDKLEKNNFNVDAVTSFDWFWGNFLGLTVYSKSIEKHGIDSLVGSILYHVTYYDYIEMEIAPLRKNIEKTQTFPKMSQVEFYKKLLSEVLDWKKCEDKLR